MNKSLGIYLVLIVGLLIHIAFHIGAISFPIALFYCVLMILAAAMSKNK